MAVTRWTARAGALAGAALLSACTTLGPDFKRPEVPWLDDWTGGSLESLAAEPTGARSSEQTHEWWRNFNDPVLDQLVAEAQRVNPNVRTAGLRIMEARAQLGIAGSTLLPAGAAGDRRGALGAESTGQRGSDTSAVAFSAGLRVSWELDFWGKFQRSIEAADAGYFASIAQYDDVQVLMAAQVASAVLLDPYRRGAASRSPPRMRRSRSATWTSPSGCSSAATTPSWMCSRPRRSTSARWPRSPRSRSACARRRTR